MTQEEADYLAELEARLAAAEENQKYNHDNLMIIERDRQKAWDRAAELEDRPLENMLAAEKRMHAEAIKGYKVWRDKYYELKRKHDD